MKSRSTIARGAPALALIAVAALFVGCGGNETVANKSARAFAAAQRRGETFTGQGHAHGGHSGDEMEAHATEHEPGGHDEGAMLEHAEMAMQGHDMAGMAGHGATAAHGHGGAPTPSHDMGAMAQGTGAMTHDMGGMAHGAHTEPPAPPPPAALSAPPGAAAATLSPDPVDAAAGTSVAEARRGAAAGAEVGGMHGMSGYRQQDAGRAPGSAPSQPTPPAHPHPTPPSAGEGTRE